MTKTWKRSLIGVLILLFCFVAGAVLFTACGENNGAVTYTVTVRVDEETPVSDVRVAIGKGGARFDAKETDANGKVEFELAPDSYEVTLSQLPDHYSVPEDANLSFTAENRNLTITLAEGFAYDIYLANPDGTPYYAAGVSVGICTLSGNCLTPVGLKEDGHARCYGAPNDYHVQILGLPAAVTFEKDNDGYYTGPGAELSAEETELTITIYPTPVVTEITSLTPMTDAQKAAYAAKNNNSYEADAVPAYHVEKELAPYETAYYSISATESGDYTFYKDGVANYLRNTQLRLGNQGNPIFSTLTIEAGEKYYFNVSNESDTAITAEFVIVAPAATNAVVKEAGAVTVKIYKEGINAVLQVAPNAGSSYKFAAPADKSVSMVLCDTKKDASDYNHAGEYDTNKEVSVKCTSDMLGAENLWVSVSIDGVTYPAEFQITVTKIADLTDTTTDKTATGLADFADVTDKTLTPLPYGSELYYDTANGYYRLNDAEGAIVVVMLTKQLDRFALSGGLVYLEEFNSYGISSNPYLIDVTDIGDADDYTKGKTFVDYRLALRGFKEYTYVPNNRGGNDVVRPAQTGNYYAKFVNSDGVYPLTEDLKAFLEGFAPNHANYITGTQGPGAPLWQFACYYYSDAAVGEQDVIVGKYEGEDYMLTVNADGSFTFSDSMGSIPGTWEKKGENSYEFTENNPTFGDTVYTVTRNAATGALTFVADDMPDAVYEVYTDPVVGSYELVSYYDPNEDETYNVGDDIYGTLVTATDYIMNVTGDSFTIQQFDGEMNDYMAVYTGTWSKNAQGGGYTFVDPDEYWGDTFTVTYDETTQRITMTGESGSAAFVFQKVQA